MLPLEERGGFLLADLGALVDNIGVSWARAPGEGAFNIWGNTFPAEELPAAGSVASVAGVPFRFPAGGDGTADNLRCAGQDLALPPTRCDWLLFLSTAERHSEDQVELSFADGEREAQWLRVSDFWPETAPRFGELLAFRCRRLHYPRHVQERMAPAIWLTRVPVAHRSPLTAVTLPDNPAIHVFALTLAQPA